MVGESDGDTDGLPEGDSLGDCEGEIVGDIVGCTVGSAPKHGQIRRYCPSGSSAHRASVCVGEEVGDELGAELNGHSSHEISWSKLYVSHVSHNL